MKVLVVTEWCPRYQEVADVSLPNMYEYAKIHGYDVHEIKLSNEEGFHYKKHEFFKEIFKKDEYALIFYRDIDAMQTNLSVPIESFIDDEHDLFICGDDIFGINGGSLIIKNTEGGKKVNDFILFHRGRINNEQEVMEFYKEKLQELGWMKILPHPSINSYPYKEYPELEMVSAEKGNWEEGQFLCHVPALEYSRRTEILRNLKIIR
jgi:hypothetical protein